MKSKKKVIVGLFLIVLVLNFPLLSALQISNVRAEDVTDTGAVVKWQTDEPADSFVFYGTSPESLAALGDANPVLNHQLPLTGLTPFTSYQYKVQSNDGTDDNQGNLYSFTTLGPDTTAPTLAVLLPPIVKGNKVEITGSTEANANVRLFVNDNLAGSTTTLTGNFTFLEILLVADQDNTIRVDAEDSAGNLGTFSGTVFPDTLKPVIKLQPLPELVETKAVEIKGTISEPAKFQIIVNNKSAAQGEGQNFSQSVSLEEGKNHLIISAADRAGWESSTEVEVTSDTQPPPLQAELERGTEYYEGRAESSIHGTTEPGATVFLYIYRPLGYEFQPDFKRARAKVTANEQGEFTFKDVEFIISVFDQKLEDIAPREVPAGLKEYSIFPIQEVAQQQQFAYYVFLIAEDQTGKGSYWQTTVNVHTCFSQNLDFSVESLPKFQTPLRLVPQLMDDGRQEIQAVFQFNYLGGSVPKQVGEIVVEPAAKVSSVKIEPACTAATLKDDKFNLGCKILPAQGNLIKNNDGSVAYVTWKLRPTNEISKREDDFWNDFKKRELIIPLKITLYYQEREGENKYGQGKFQTSCTDLGYFIDIPLKSSELIPDFLADEGVEFLDESVQKLTTAREFLEKAFIVAGFGCMGSFLGRTAGRWVRIVTSKFEQYTSYFKFSGIKRDEIDKESKGCKNPSDYYLEEEIKYYLTFENPPQEIKGANNNPTELGKLTLEKRCPNTAAAWKFEALMNAAYRWSCDRAFCSKVPAAWTADAKDDAIGAAIVKQQECAVTGRGIPLIKRENCQELVKTAVTAKPVEIKGGVCWQTAKGTLYFNDESVYFNDESVQNREQASKGIFLLKPVSAQLGDLKVPETPLKVYKPEGADNYVVGREESCQTVCKNPRRPGFQADTDGGVVDVVEGKTVKNGCYIENIQGGEVELIGNGGVKFKNINKEGKARYMAGYTSDCFVEPDETSSVVKQCVCIKDESQKLTVGEKVHVAGTKENGEPLKEKWFYHQERVFQESGKKKGTYYPEIRYFSERDFSGAFGQNHLLDVVTGKKDIPTVDPHAQFVGALQTVCLSSTLKNIRMLESIMTGMRNCLVEAKKTGLQDAGMCKTLFTQHVCGLIYKAIAYIAGGCNPVNIEDYNNEGRFGDVGVLFSTGLGEIPNALESSVKDLKDDYGNAQLNQYFKAGAQGFVQTICLAALGIEFPLFSKEFLLDAAYAVPMKTSVVMAPRERELSTYNPAKQTAVFNYNIGGIILPGCRIRQWSVSLKCIGPEDVELPGIDRSCNGKGCDCINAQSVSSPLEGEKTALLKTGFDLKSGEMFSIPLESPLPLDKHYRYDHLKVELTLDQSEKGNEDKCFDEGYFVGGKGVFYEPLIDTSPVVEISCKANLLTGRYECPELASLLGFGGAAFEEPYADCWSSRLNQWISCDSPNLFITGDEIKVRLHLNLDDKGKCLKRTVQPIVPGIPSETNPIMLAENMPGQLLKEQTLGTVNEAMFGGITSNIVLKQGSNPGCGLGRLSFPAESSPGEYQFQFIQQGANAELVVPSGAVIETSGYSTTPDRKLSKNGQTQFTVDEVNQVTFNFGGFKVNTILGTINPTLPNQLTACIYQITSGQQLSSGLNTREIHVTYELLERDEGGSCGSAKIPVKSQKAIHTIKIRLQKQAQELIGLHDNFKSGNYDSVQASAADIIKLMGGDLNNALAIYYWVASLVMKGPGVTPNNNAEIKNLLTLFFERKDWQGQTAQPYNLGTTSSVEYQKINAYLCEIAKTPQVNYQPLPRNCPAP